MDRQGSRGRRRRYLTLAGLVAGIIVTLFMMVVGQGWSFLKQAELAGYDTQFALRGPIAHTDEIVVLSVDANSVTVLSPGTIPLRRYWMGRAIDFLCHAKVKAIGIDFSYFSPSTYDHFTHNADTQALAAALNRCNKVVLNEEFEGAGTSSNMAGATLVPPIDPLRSYAHLGLSNVPLDSDNVIRRAWNLQTGYGNLTEPAFPVVVASVAKHKSVQQILSGLPRQMLINYVGRQDPSGASQSWNTVQFAGVALGEDPASLFRNKIVLIVPAAILFEDNHTTPFGDMFGGYIQANTLNTILEGNPIVPARDIVNSLVLLLLGLLSTVAVTRFGLWRGSGAALLLAVAYGASTVMLFEHYRTWLHLVIPEATILLVVAVILPINLYVRRSLHQELYALQANFRALVESAREAVITTDEDMRVVTWNPAAERVFGYTAPEIAGQPIARVIPADGWEGTNTASIASSSTGISPSQREAVGRRADGALIPLELGISESLREGSRSFLIIARDISARKLAEQELADARDRALEANRTKSTFLANMSHELRTPLNAIIGYSEILIEDVQDTGDKGALADLQRIHAAGKHLLSLINDVLDLSKIEAGRMEVYIESFDVAAMIGEVATTVQPLVDANENQLHLLCPADLGSMRSDQTKIRQILFNLLSNAGKFTRRGHVTLAAERDKVDPTIRFVVMDTGIGMTAEQINRLFQAFSQGDATIQARYGGTGLGLALSRRFCRMLGGDISVESELGKGSSFTVALPTNILPDQQGVPPLEELQPLPTGAPTVLVVDDDPVARDLITRALRRSGIRAVTASNGREGVDRARMLRPDAITLDVLMPEIDGWTALAELKDDSHLADIPVILLTVLDDPTMGYSLGAADFLTKPVDQGRLVSVVRRHLRAPGHSVLLVDDDANTRAMFRRTLESEGWTVVEAENGRLALEQIRESVPDLILLDLIMPEMDGFELIDELRRGKLTPTIPIIVVSAKELTPTDRARLEGKVADVVHKGARSSSDLLADVVARVRQVVEARGDGALT